MASTGSKFTRKKEEAIAALLTNRNLEEAAKSIGIGLQTMLRWMKIPEFDAARRQARRAAIEIEDIDVRVAALEQAAELSKSSGQNG